MVSGRTQEYRFAFFTAVAALGAITVTACSSDAAVTPGPASPDAGSTGTPRTSGDDDDDDVVSRTKDGGTVDASRPRLPPVFLDEAEYADLVTIDARFPYGVTQRHVSDGDILGSRWGRHGGPMVTLGAYGDTHDPAVVQWKLPADATGAATATPKPFARASGLPSDFFYGADGMVDLPFGSLSLLDYTGPDSPFAGEALIYDATYQTVKSRAKANGFYSGAGIADGNDGLLVYSGLSELTNDEPIGNDSGLYVTGICAEKVAAPAPCPESRQLFGWNGNSGPVVTDLHGNAFVAASLTNGDTSDAIYGLGRKEITSGAVVQEHTIASIDSVGTASIAVLTPEGEASGWVVGLGFAEKAPVYAAPYLEKSGAVAAGAGVLVTAIERADGVDGVSVFADDEGDLWLAVIKGSKGTYLELRRKPD